MLDDGEVDDVLEAIKMHFADRLSVWEEGFVESVADRRDRGEHLTPGQRAKLDEVFERVSRGGRG